MSEALELLERAKVLIEGQQNRIAELERQIVGEMNQSDAHRHERDQLKAKLDEAQKERDEVLLEQSKIHSALYMGIYDDKILRAISILKNDLKDESNRANQALADLAASQRSEGLLMRANSALRTDLAAIKAEHDSAWSILAGDGVRCYELSTQAAGVMSYVKSLEGQVAAEREKNTYRHCTCDDHSDAPCPVHQREVQLQNERDIARAVAAQLKERAEKAERGAAYQRKLGDEFLARAATAERKLDNVEACFETSKAEVARQFEENKQLKEELEDWNDSARTAAMGGYADEKHCTCVPLLQKSLNAAREQAKALADALRIVRVPRHSEQVDAALAAYDKETK